MEGQSLTSLSRVRKRRTLPDAVIDVHSPSLIIDPNARLKWRDLTSHSSQICANRPNRLEAGPLNLEQRTRPEIDGSAREAAGWKCKNMRQMPGGSSGSSEFFTQAWLHYKEIPNVQLIRNLALAYYDT